MRPSATLASFPHELLYKICQYLPTEQIPIFRLLNKQCAAVGVEFLLPHVVYFVSRRQLDRLEAITQHPTIPRYVSQFRFDSALFASEPATYTVFQQIVNRPWAGNPDTEAILQEKYRLYKKALAEQNDMITSHRCYRALKDFFLKCQRLDVVEFAEEYSYVDRGEPSHGMIRLKGPEDVRAAGGLVAMLRALSDAEAKVRDITIAPTTWRVLKSRSLLGDLRPPFTTSVQSLALSLATISDSVGEDQDEAREYMIKTSALRTLLSGFPNLKELQVDMDSADWDDPMYMPVLFSDIDGGTLCFQHLRQLTLGGMNVEEAMLIAFLERHKTTLRGLSLFDIWLMKIGDSWLTFLPRVRRAVKLEKASITGTLGHHMAAEYWHLEDPIERPRGLSRRLERYLLYGGRLPLSTENNGKEEAFSDSGDDDDEDVMDLWIPIEEPDPM